MGRPGLLVVIMSNVVRLNNQKADWQHDIDEYERELQNMEKGFVEMKGHLLFLVSKIAENVNLPTDIRIQACRIIWIHAPARIFLSNVLQTIDGVDYVCDCDVQLANEVGFTGPLAHLLANAK